MADIEELKEKVRLKRLREQVLEKREQEGVKTAVSPEEAPREKTKRIFQERRERVVEEQGVGPLERSMVHTLRDDPEAQMQYLQQEGYETKRVGDSIHVRGPKGPWKVVDPEGIQSISDLIQDVNEAVQEHAFEIGTATVGSGVVKGLGRILAAGAKAAARDTFVGRGTAAMGKEAAKVLKELRQMKKPPSE